MPNDMDTAHHLNGMDIEFFHCSPLQRQEPALHYCHGNCSTHLIGHLGAVVRRESLYVPHARESPWVVAGHPPGGVGGIVWISPQKQLVQGEKRARQGFLSELCYCAYIFIPEITHHAGAIGRH